jgi:hypothetical protein
VGFAYKHTNPWQGQDTNWGCDGFSFIDGSTDQVGFYLEDADNTIRIRRGDQNDTQLGTTASNLLTANTWAYIEFKVTFHPTNGSYELIIEGDSVASATGIDTTKSANSYANGIRLWGRVYNWSNSYYEDLYLLDDQGDEPTDFVGNSVVQAKDVVSNGDTNNFIPSSGSNYENVDDDNPDGDSTYNEVDLPGIVGKKDLYNTEDTDGEGYIKGIQVVTTAKKMQAGTRKIKELVKVGGSENLGNEHTLNTDYEMFITPWSKNPTSGSGWEHSDFNAAQIGLEVTE